MNTFVVHPEEGDPHPVVLFYMDAPGKREELHDMARRIAAVSYFVVLPNLYYHYRKTRQFTMERTEEGFKRMFAMRVHLTDDLVMRDTKAMLAFVDRERAAKAWSLGCVGYCMSGPYVFMAAGRFPERVKCAASIYGVQLATDEPDSPHLLAHKVKSEFYFGCAEVDKYIPTERVHRLDAHLKTLPDLRWRIEWYNGVEHRFAFPRRVGIYHRPSAERHWERLFALFRRNVA